MYKKGKISNKSSRRRTSQLAFYKKETAFNGNMMLLDSFTNIFMANKILIFFDRFRLGFRLETTRLTENLFRHVLLVIHFIDILCSK